ncbi:hypothetical protein B0H10DRAFT_1884611, partial [Mycena sp. CBHHK59/15]
MLPAESWVWKSIRTTVNAFGLFRDYPSIPTYNPDAPDEPAPSAPVPSLPAREPAPAASTSTSTPSQSPPSDTAPFRNWSVMGLMTWLWTGSATKSVDEMDKLVEILQNPRFSKDDIMDFNVRQETAKFDEHLSDSSSTIRDGWKSASVNISIPDGHKHASEADAPVFPVPGLFYRPLTEVIKSAIRDVGDRCFHYTPFKQFWTPSPGSPPERIYDEIYSSDAMVEAHTVLQNQPREPGCTLERVILSLMFWSYSTHLASFGDASLWPLYLFFGNQSKWLRVKPRSNVCHHVAYFPKVCLSL